MCIASARGDRESSRHVTSAGSESDEGGTYGGQRGRTFAKKHRQKMQDIASRGGTPQLSEVRFSTRRAAKPANYDEDQDLGLSDEYESDTATPNYYYVEDNTPAIDLVLNHRLKEGIGMIGIAPANKHNLADLFRIDASNSDKHDYEFYVRVNPITWMKTVTDTSNRSNGKVKHIFMLRGILGPSSLPTKASVALKTTSAKPSR